MATVPAEAPVHLLVILFAGVALLCALPYVARYSLPLVFGDVHHNAPMRSLREALGGDASPGLRWAMPGLDEVQRMIAHCGRAPCPAPCPYPRVTACTTTRRCAPSEKRSAATPHRG